MFACADDAGGGDEAPDRILIFVWLACGLFGAWRLGDTRIKTIVRGPITMAKAFNDAPVSYPGPN
jgi:hypothetical protein